MHIRKEFSESASLHKEEIIHGLSDMLNIFGHTLRVSDRDENSDFLLIREDFSTVGDEICDVYEKSVLDPHYLDEA